MLTVLIPTGLMVVVSTFLCVEPSRNHRTCVLPEDFKRRRAHHRCRGSGYGLRRCASDRSRCAPSVSLRSGLLTTRQRVLLGLSFSRAMPIRTLSMALEGPKSKRMPGGGEMYRTSRLPIITKTGGRLLVGSLGWAVSLKI